jgi:hypothetical protein
MRAHLFALAVVAAGCVDTTICDRLAYALDLQDKTRDCKWDHSDRFDHERCVTNVGQCNGDDRSRIEQMSACIEALPNCQASKETEFAFSFIPCAGHATSLSTACRDGVGLAHGK